MPSLSFSLWTSSSPTGLVWLLMRGSSRLWSHSLKSWHISLHTSLEPWSSICPSICWWSCSHMLKSHITYSIDDTSLVSLCCKGLGPLSFFLEVEVASCKEGFSRSNINTWLTYCDIIKWMVSNHYTCRSRPNHRTIQAKLIIPNIEVLLVAYNTLRLLVWILHLYLTSLLSLCHLSLTITRIQLSTYFDILRDLLVMASCFAK